MSDARPALLLELREGPTTAIEANPHALVGYDACTPERSARIWPGRSRPCSAFEQTAGRAAIGVGPRTASSQSRWNSRDVVVGIGRWQVVCLDFRFVVL